MHSNVEISIYCLAIPSDARLVSSNIFARTISPIHASNSTDFRFSTPCFIESKIKSNLTIMRILSNRRTQRIQIHFISSLSCIFLIHMRKCKITYTHITFGLSWIISFPYWVLFLRKVYAFKWSNHINYAQKVSLQIRWEFRWKIGRNFRLNSGQMIIVLTFLIWR